MVKDVIPKKEPAESNLKGRSKSCMPERPRTSVHSTTDPHLQSLLNQRQDDRELRTKLKKQSFHISGHDYSYVPAKAINKTMNVHSAKDLASIESSANKHSRVNKHSNSKLHFRTSF
jgi:hypothetical protein